MCGIGGIAYADIDRVPPARQLIGMAWAMAHRGPDDQGFCRQPGIGLCFRRLSIIDHQGGHQPISNEDGSVWLTCNGEIYNHRKLREQLQARGHHFRGNSDDTLLKADKLTMACSLELRVPFLDRQLAEYAASLPPRLKIRGKVLRHILRKAVADILPPEVIQRPKLGFTAPITSWINHELHGLAAAVLQSEQFRQREYFRPEAIEGLLMDTRPYPARGRQIFTLLVLELWHRLFIDGEWQVERQLDPPVEPNVEAATCEPHLELGGFQGTI